MGKEFTSGYIEISIYGHGERNISILAIEKAMRRVCPPIIEHQESLHNEPSHTDEEISDCHCISSVQIGIPLNFVLLNMENNVTVFMIDPYVNTYDRLNKEIKTRTKMIHSNQIIERSWPSAIVVQSYIIGESDAMKYTFTGIESACVMQSIEFATK